MELIVFLFILAFVLLFIKGLGLILKTGLFILSIPILLIVSFVMAVVIFSLLRPIDWPVIWHVFVRARLSPALKTTSMHCET